MYIPTIIFKTPQLTKHFSSMHPRGNTQLQIRKWWVTLRSVFIYPFFVRLFSIPLNKQHHMPNIEKPKRQFTSSKQQLFIHQQYQYQISNLKESQNYIICYTTITLKKNYVQMPTYRRVQEKRTCTLILRSYYYI